VSSLNCIIIIIIINSIKISTRAWPGAPSSTGADRRHSPYTATSTSSRGFSRGVRYTHHQLQVGVARHKGLLFAAPSAAGLRPRYVHIRF